MEHTQNPYNLFAIKQGDKFTCNFTHGVISIREILDNGCAVMDFEDERAKHLRGGSWLITTIEDELKKGNLHRLISYQFRRKSSDGSFTRGFGFWEEMADRFDWDFVSQFLPDYDSRDDVMISDDLECVINDNNPDKDLAWLYETYPEWDGLTVEELEKVRVQWDYELQVEAEAALIAAIQAGEIEVREFPVKYVSAKINRDITLQYADERWTNFGETIILPSSELQDVKSRVVDNQFQIYYTNQSSGDEYWCNAQSIDFQ